MSQHGSTSYTPEGAAAQLHALARLCFGRALGACWLIPCMDLVVRVKLNIIGRHLFLQEKLLKLKHTGGTAHTQNGLLPPRLTASAIEKFLECGWPTSQGGHECMVSKVMSGIDRVLEGLSLEVEVAPADLFRVMASMLKEAETIMSQHTHVEGFSFPTQSHSELEQSKAIDVSDGGSLKTAHGGSAPREGSYFST
ncbi:hypothetical protein CEUSTIGMA_g13678.t1 [Chlamydomonas eustigma]|uniref:Uncharacterized protein n=1 Tax=Chlamydomonas eustigma TaxID=1157962 RepID=A0A250XT98_9CHLO|nr:hypothetical protein CEUSTIGMA_g13678.t1 [Chlamydomonas eustigma]|eukprot:GAX86266.1 hypothetical protein CEUSTIGMA_g13678.t1 [Chlamydomonas eustigma]